MKFEDLLNKENLLLIIREGVKHEWFNGYTDDLLMNVIDIENIIFSNDLGNPTVYFTMVTKPNYPYKKRRWRNYIEKPGFEKFIINILHEQREEKIKRILNET